MNIDAEKIDLLMLSHEHGDHTAGILAFVKLKKGIPVIIPYSFSESFKKEIVNYGLDPLLVKEHDILNSFLNRLLIQTDQF